MSKVLVGVALVLSATVVPLSGAESAQTQTATGSVAVCAPAEPGSAPCLSRLQVSTSASLSRPSGFSPKTIKGVYGFPTSERAGKGQTIALVEAYHAPNAESHLKVFSNKFDLPACRSLNSNPLLFGGCFQQVYATGVQPPTDPGWAIETDLDVQWAHAIAPGAKIVVVEAASNGLADLFTAVSVAQSLPNVRYMSLSWGTPEFAGESGFEVFFQAPGASFFVSAGDSPQVLYPSASPNVVSVGGTTLKVKENRRRSETAWINTGGGCSAFSVAHPAQAGFFQYGQTGCNGSRSTPDLAVVGDPLTGVSIYTTNFAGVTGWDVGGGTSVSAPIIAGWAASTGQQVNASFTYGLAVNFFTRFFDITAGQPSCLVGFDTCSGRGSLTRASRDDH